MQKMQRIPEFIAARTEVEIFNTRTGAVTALTLDDTIGSDVEVKVRELDPPTSPHDSKALAFSDLRIGMTVEEISVTLMETRRTFMIDGEPTPCSCKCSFKGYGKDRKKIGIAPGSLWELPVIWILQHQ